MGADLDEFAGADPAEIGHEHPDVTGGWLRPAVFGAMDGLVSNFALIMGVAGGVAALGGPDEIILAGLAGLVAGAFSMAAGEYTSVASQSEFAQAQIKKEREEIIGNEHAERAELVVMLMRRGLSKDLAKQAAKDIHRDLDVAVRVHAQEEFGVDADNLASPYLAAASSFVAFAVGAVVPLLPYLLGATSPIPAVVLSLVALFGCGSVVTWVTDRSWWFGGIRQLLLGAGAAGITYLAGTLVGSVLS